MNLTLTDEQRSFVEAIRDFAQRECGTREQRDALTDNGREPHNAELCARIADLGWLGVGLPEEYGGSGAAARSTTSSSPTATCPPTGCSGSRTRPGCS